MSIHKKILVLAIALYLPLANVMAAPVSHAELQAQIVQLQQLVAELQQKLIASVSGSQLTAYSSLISCTDLQYNMSKGDNDRKTNNEVSKVQQFFIEEGVYPDALVTGHFGVLTEEATQNFQIKYNIVTSGNPNTTGFGAVGPQTRTKIKELTCGSTSDPVNIPPVANAGPDQTLTDTDGNGSEFVTLDSRLSYDADGTIVYYNWSKSGVAMSTEPRFTADFGIGTHQINLVIRDNDGAINYDSVVITVLSGNTEPTPNTPPVARAGSDQTLTDTDGDGSEFVTLDGTSSSDSDGSISYYNWRENNNLIAVGAKPTVSMNVGTHNVTLEVTDNDGATDTDTVSITVNGGSSNPGSSLELQSSTFWSSSGNLSLTLTGASPNANIIVTDNTGAQKNFGVAPSNSSNSETYKQSFYSADASCDYTVSDGVNSIEFTVSGSSNYGCGSRDSDTTPTDPQTNPSPDVSLTVFPSSIEQGGNAALYWSSTYADSCSGTGFSTGGAVSGTKVVYPTANTTYSVSCTGAGGTAQDSTSITVTSVTVPTDPTDPIPVSGDGIWISPAELSALPTSGTAWNNLKDEALGSLGSVRLDDNNSLHDTAVLALAYYAVRTGSNSDIDKVVQEISTVPGSPRTRALEFCRNITSYIIAADVIDLKQQNSTVYNQFTNFIRNWVLEDSSLQGHSGSGIKGTAAYSANNWGGMCRAAYAATALYLNDQTAISNITKWHKGFLGDKSVYNGLKYTSTNWHANSNDKVSINRVGATIDGRNVDGLIPEDQRRTGEFEWPAPKGSYPWEAMQGALVTDILLQRAGLITANYENNAMKRAYIWLNDVNANPASGDDRWQVWVSNKAYGLNYPTSLGVSPGKLMGWTDWTHQ